MRGMQVWGSAPQPATVLFIVARQGNCFELVCWCVRSVAFRTPVGSAKPVSAPGPTHVAARTDKVHCGKRGVVPEAFGFWATAVALVDWPSRRLL